MSIIPLERPIIETASVMGTDKGGIFFKKVYENVTKVLFYDTRQLLQITEYDDTEHDIDILSGATATTLFAISILSNGNYSFVQSTPTAPPAVIQANPALQQPDVAILQPPLFGPSFSATPFYGLDKGTVVYEVPPAIQHRHIQKFWFDPYRQWVRFLLHNDYEMTFDTFPRSRPTTTTNFLVIVRDANGNYRLYRQGGV